MRTWESRFLSLRLGLALLGACGDSGSGSPGTGPLVSGQIQGWTQGTGYTVLLTMGSTTNPTTVALSAIDASGNFSLSLPDASLVTPLLTMTSTLWGPPNGCPGALTVAPATAQGGLASFVAAMDHTVDHFALVSGPVPTTGNVDVTGASYLYSDQDAMVSGTLSCSGPKLYGMMTFSLSLKQGWNELSFHLTGAQANGGTAVAGTEAYASGPQPSGLSWTLNPNL